MVRIGRLGARRRRVDGDLGQGRFVFGFFFCAVLVEPVGAHPSAERNPRRKFSSVNFLCREPVKREDSRLVFRGQHFRNGRAAEPFGFKGAEILRCAGANEQNAAVREPLWRHNLQHFTARAFERRRLHRPRQRALRLLVEAVEGFRVFSIFIERDDQSAALRQRGGGKGDLHEPLNSVLRRY